MRIFTAVDTAARFRPAAHHGLAAIFEAVFSDGRLRITKELTAMNPYLSPVSGGTAAIGRPECWIRAAAGAAALGAVLAGMVNRPDLVFGLSLLGVYLMHTVVMRRDLLYYIAVCLHMPDRVQLWEYLAASAVLIVIIKGGHVHGALTALMFASYAAFLAVANLINRGGSGTATAAYPPRRGAEDLAGGLTMARRPSRPRWAACFHISSLFPPY